MHVEATVQQNGEFVEIIYGDYPSLDGLDVGTRISSDNLNINGTHSEYEILSRELVDATATTQIDPEQRQQTIRLTLNKIN